MREKPELFVPILPDFDLPLISFYVIPESVDSGDFPRLALEQKRIQEELLTKNLMVVSLSALEANSNSTIHPELFLTISLTNSILNPADLHHILRVIELVANQEQNLSNLSLSPPLLNTSSLEPFQNSPIRVQHEQFFRDIFSLFTSKGLYFSRKEEPSHFLQPQALYEKMNFSSGLGEESVSQAELLNVFDKTINYSPHWGHPYFIYQLTAGYMLSINSFVNDSDVLICDLHHFQTSPT